ncbi:MAG: beta-galactosidase [Candidatus Puniceispirillaceae bacterium]
MSGTISETGVCYYPEHWPRELWDSDAKAMVEAGISWVRIAEFSWIKMEPEEGIYDFSWLDDAVEILGSAGLKIIMCTPTATPPKWLVDKMPDMLAVDSDGRSRGYGSRRHYSFSHQGYIEECKRITTKLAQRYGQNPYIQAWQTDNEYGCHDTAISWCENAKLRFRAWLSERYGTIEALNEAWGTIFWSMAYRSFDEIELPNLTVTEANPSHNMDFRRFSTDEIVHFDRAQTQIIREHSGDKPISHNFMGDFNQFNARPVAANLDIATWDSYPLGFLQNMQKKARRDSELEIACLRVGDPDFQAFHHDLYRGMARLWIMEQQPGPVNWAAYNPIPAKGAVRLWSWEAFAHDAEVVSYFRWRQAPFAQEQMHAGLMLRNNQPAPALAEVRQLNDELTDINLGKTEQAPVALIHDYEADWMTEFDGQTEDFYYLRLVLDIYRAVRQNGGSIDVIGPEDSIDGYKLLIVPSLLCLSDELANRVKQSGCRVLAGPRTGLKTTDFQLPSNLMQDVISQMTGFQTERIDALPSHMPITAHYHGIEGNISIWREEGKVTGAVMGECADGLPFATSGNQGSYLCAWPDEVLLKAVIGDTMRAADIACHDMPDYLRVRQRGSHLIFTHYGPDTVQIPDSFEGDLLLGKRQMNQADVTIMKVSK